METNDYNIGIAVGVDASAKTRDLLAFVYHGAIPMAPERPPSASDPLLWVPPETCEAVCRAIDQRLRDKGADVAIHAAVITITQDARAENVKVERIIIALKHLWASVAPVADTHDTQDRTRVLESMVSLAIRTYYTDTEQSSGGHVL